MKKQMKTGGIGFYILILGIIFLAVWVSGNYGGNTGDGYNLASFKDDVMDGNVASVRILPNEEVPTGEVSVQLRNKKTVSFFVSDVTMVENIVYADTDLAKNCVVKDIQKPSWVFTTLLWQETCPAHRPRRAFQEVSGCGRVEGGEGGAGGDC